MTRPYYLARCRRGWDVTDAWGYTVAGPYRSLVKAWRIARSLNAEARS